MNNTELTEIRWTDAVQLASPHPYVLVTTVDQSGRPDAIGIGWFTIVSWSPPMVAIGVAPARHSYSNLEQVPEFVVNFPTPRLSRAAWACGTTSGARVDKFKANGMEALPSGQVRPPTIGGSLMAWECKVVQKMDTGDHRLYVGEILAVKGDLSQSAHLYSIHYRKLVSVDHKAGTIVET